MVEVWELRSIRKDWNQGPISKPTKLGAFSPRDDGCPQQVRSVLTLYCLLNQLKAMRLGAGQLEGGELAVADG